MALPKPSLFSNMSDRNVAKQNVVRSVLKNISKIFFKGKFLLTKSNTLQYLCSIFDEKKVTLGSYQKTKRNIPSLEQKSSFQLYLILKKNAKIIYFMTYSVEFLNDFILVFNEVYILNRCGEKTMPLSHFGEFDGDSTANQFAAQSQRIRSAFTAHSQRIHSAFTA